MNIMIKVKCLVVEMYDIGRMLVLVWCCVYEINVVLVFGFSFISGWLCSIYVYLVIFNIVLWLYF